jgi:putative phosphoesterase
VVGARFNYFPVAGEDTGMERVAILADTHIPSRADTLPDTVENELEDANVVIHAGDFADLDAFETVRDLADELVAVYGNTDPRHLDLSAVDSVWVEDVQFVVTHGHGGNYDQRVLRAVRDERDTPDAVGVSGHTHERRDVEIEGVRLLNPGSATGVSPADEATMLVADVDGDEVSVSTVRP